LIVIFLYFIEGIETFSLPSLLFDLLFIVRIFWVVAMTFWRITLGLYLGSFLSVLFSMPIAAIAQINPSWKIIGQPVIEFQDGENSKEKISQLNRRFSEIVARLNPNQTWTVDLAPIPQPKSKPLKKGEKPKPPLPAKQVTIRLQGMSLLQVNESDAKLHQAESPRALAENWARSLANFLSPTRTRQTILATLNLPERVTYEGLPYSLKPEIALDRGLFRVSGRQFEGRSVFIELPADQSSFKITELTPTPKISSTKEFPKSVYLLNSQFQFVPYTR